MNQLSLKEIAIRVSESENERLKQDILAEAERTGSLLFTEVERIFQEHNFAYKGGYAVVPSKERNLGTVSYWYDWSKEACSLILELLHTHKLTVVPTHPLSYLANGCYMQVPIVKSIRCYKTEHWIPSQLVPYEEGDLK